VAKTTPQQAAQDWANRLSQSTDKMKRGIEAVTESPGVAAARQKEKWLARITESANKWATNVAATDLSYWKSQATGIGLQRVGQGAMAKQAKMADFMQGWLPHMDALKQKLASMPSTTYEQRKARAIAAMDHGHSYTRNR
jgi:hypothetical protein